MRDNPFLGQYSLKSQEIRKWRGIMTESGKYGWERYGISSEMKGIIWEVGEMEFPLKPNSNPVRQKPYRLNPVYRKKMKEEIDRILEARIIEPIIE
jgi:hypothetical protein